jgi:hypothetical protein
VRIRWLPPLDRFFGPVSELALQGPTAIPEVLGRLTAQVPELGPYAKFGPGDRQPYGLLVLRGGEVLTLADRLEPEDHVEMLMMVAGG